MGKILDDSGELSRCGKKKIILPAVTAHIRRILDYPAIGTVLTQLLIKPRRPTTSRHLLDTTSHKVQGGEVSFCQDIKIDKGKVVEKIKKPTDNFVKTTTH